MRTCPLCGETLPLTEEFFYKFRPGSRVREYWQTYCRSCWVVINASNKLRRKLESNKKREPIS